MQALKTQVDHDRAVKHITEVIQPLPKGELVWVNRLGDHQNDQRSHKL